MVIVYNWISLFIRIYLNHQDFLNNKIYIIFWVVYSLAFFKCNIYLHKKTLVPSLFCYIKQKVSYLKKIQISG